MPPEEIIQLMRTCTIAQIGAQLETDLTECPEQYVFVAEFFVNASKQPKQPKE